MANDSIAVVCLSKRLSLEDAMTMVDACDRQAAEDFCPVWGVKHRPINLYSDIADLPPLTTDPIFILDTPGRGGVLGEHFRALTPTARIFVDPIYDDGAGVALAEPGDPDRLTVASVLSHEILELLADPNIDQYAMDGAGNEWDLEVCDPVQRNQVTKQAQMPWGTVDVRLSDFVLPSFFHAGAVGPWNFDPLVPLTGPFTIAPGGYAMKNGDPIFARRADGSAIYPPRWWLAYHMGGRGAKRIIFANRERRRLA